MTFPSQKDSWKMFDRISASYDKVNRILSFGMDRSWRRQAACCLPQKPDLRLLDLASGTGDQIIACFEGNASIASAVGVDLAEDMLRIGFHKINAKPYGKNVSFLQGDAQSIPLADASFDAAMLSFGIRNVSNPQKTLEEMHRVLKPDGRAVVLEFSLPPKPWRFFHLLYLRHFLPRIGEYFSGNREAYRYLNQTIETFPSGEAFCRLLRSARFRNVRALPLALGAVTIYIGDKS